MATSRRNAGTMTSKAPSCSVAGNPRPRRMSATTARGGQAPTTRWMRSSRSGTASGRRGAG